MLAVRAPRTNDEKAEYETAQPCFYPFGERIWREVGDFRDGLMAGLGGPSSTADIAVNIAKNATTAAKRKQVHELKALREKIPASEAAALNAMDQAIEKLMHEVLSEEGQRHVELKSAKAILKDRVRMFLEEDVLAGRLVRRCKDENYYVAVDDLLPWADFRKITVERELAQEAQVVQVRVDGAGIHQTSRHAVGMLGASVAGPAGKGPTPAPWWLEDARDHKPEGFQPWYVPARYFARQLVLNDPTLLAKRDVLVAKVAKSLEGVNINKRGGKKAPSSGTVRKALVKIDLSPSPTTNEN